MSDPDRVSSESVVLKPGTVVEVGPHDFRRIEKPGLFRGGPCRDCYLQLDDHPTVGWTEARPSNEPEIIPGD